MQIDKKTAKAITKRIMQEYISCGVVRDTEWGYLIDALKSDEFIVEQQNIINEEIKKQIKRDTKNMR